MILTKVATALQAILYEKADALAKKAASFNASANSAARTSSAAWCLAGWAILPAHWMD
ncbi:hypothetical protein [Thiothrix caldifontis]|uniref:hypothetical protein n=1 Tax=Thiothrix caldifontis TaxID=525918 RepID=UPI001587674A|nr:hypothetical protein [Thiothrix caldifontis]